MTPKIRLTPTQEIKLTEDQKNVRIRIERIDGDTVSRLKKIVEDEELGTLEHITGQSWLYVDVKGEDPDEVIERAMNVLQPYGYTADSITITTAGAPLDQPGSLPVSKDSDEEG